MSYRCLLVALTLLSLSASSSSLAQTSSEPSNNDVEANSTDSANPQAAAEAFPDLSIPANANLPTLEDLVRRAKAARPRSPDQFRSMQSAIRDASRQITKLLAGSEETPQFRQAELDVISSSVSLMTFSDEDAQSRTLEQVHEFLKSRKQLSMQDIQTGILASAALELQPNKKPARDTYQLLDDLLKDDEREEMQSLRLNLQAAIRRLNLLGAPFEFKAQTVDGEEIKIEDFAGKFVIVDFFATWCEPCLVEVPRLQKYYEKYQAKGLEVIGISLDAEAENLNSYLERTDLPWPIVHDNAADPLERLQMKFGVSHLPTVLLLNKEGTVVSLEARGAELDRLLQMLFEAPTPAAERNED